MPATTSTTDIEHQSAGAIPQNFMKQACVFHAVASSTSSMKKLDNDAESQRGDDPADTEHNKGQFGGHNKLIMVKIIPNHDE